MYGVIDIGSNTIRLSVYKKVDGDIRLILNKKHMTGLAGYVNAYGYLTENGIRKAIRDLMDFKHIIDNIELKEIFVFATASLRNIKNTDDAMSQIKHMTGFDIELISGEMEAKYDFYGATRFMKLNSGLLVDIGGGSTELVHFTDGSIDEAISIPMGSLSLYKKFVSEILPTAGEMDAMKKYIKAELKKVDIQSKHGLICGVGGSIRGTLKLTNDLYNLDLNGRDISPKHVNKTLKAFQSDRSYAVTNIIKNTPDRMHTILPGMTILKTIAKKYEVEGISVSQYGIREGYLYTKLGL